MVLEELPREQRPRAAPRDQGLGVLNIQEAAAVQPQVQEVPAAEVPQVPMVLGPMVEIYPPLEALMEAAGAGGMVAELTGPQILIVMEERVEIISGE